MSRKEGEKKDVGKGREEIREEKKGRRKEGWRGRSKGGKKEEEGRKK